MDISTFVFLFVFAALIIIILFQMYERAIKMYDKRARNAAAPRLAQAASVVTKRQYVGGASGMTSTLYYATFEFADRGRRELRLSPKEYGLLVEGDAGTLHSQGSWFKGFDRQ
jgi:Protein of unknown function (DUF2500)